VENYGGKESTPKAVLLTASSTSQSEILEDTNGGPDIELGSEEQKKKGVPTHEDERLKEKGERMTEKPDQVSELRKENGSVKKEHQLEFLRVLQEKSTEFDTDENRDSPRDKNLSADGSVGPIEDVSEDFDKMNRGQDVVTESERIKRLEERITQVEEEKEMIREENNILKQKTQPELFKELQEKFYDEPGILDANKLHKVSESVGKVLVILLGHYNSILKDAVESGQPVPLGTYIITKPEKKLIPVRVFIDFDRRMIKIELWQKKLQSFLN
jgi:hypothetical protein